MKFTTLLSSLAVMAATAVASPVQQRDLEVRGSSTKSAFKPTPILLCLNSFQANAIVNAFNYLLANPTASNFQSTANSLFSDDFTDTSDSINQLAGIPEGSTTFSNKADFISSSSAQPPLVLTTLDVFWSCNAISWRWISVSGTGDDSTKVKGIDNFYINKKGQIQSVYAEFNSGAWLKDLGYPECSAASSSASSS